MDRRSFLKQFNSIPGTPAASRSEMNSPLSSPERLQALANGSGDRSTLSTTLAEWKPTAGQWDEHTINHLYRRAGYGATMAEINAAKAKSPGAVIDALLDNSLVTTKLPLEPNHSGNWLRVTPYLGSDPQRQRDQLSSYYNYNSDIRAHWVEQIGKPETMLRERLVQLWMNHFVIEEIKVYYPQIIYRYMDYLRRNAWGNFKQMVKEITIQPAMLIYLDGVANVRGVPNENYAREVMELFTLGVTDKDGNPNYTEADIRGMATALTGYTVDASAAAPNVLPAKFDTSRHDATFKTIFTVKKQWGLASSGVPDDVIDLLFDKRGQQLAWYICSKLYQFFVYNDISGAGEKAIIDEMAQTFIASNWELKPVIAQLLKSEHFFDEANIGANIKSPIEHLVGMSRQFDISLDVWQSGSLVYYSAAGNQTLLDPPNVKGWPGYHSWISTTTLPYRDYVAYLVAVTTLPAYGADSNGKLNTAITLSDANLTTWAKQFANYNGALDDLIPELTHFLCAQQPSSVVDIYIKGKLTQNAYEWEKLTDAEKIIPLRTMLFYIMNLADYQLS